MPTIGVAIITKNAQVHLADCLNAVTWCDKIVVLDSGSTDQTLSIAQAYGAQIEQTSDWPGFGIQKNRAIALLDTDWILALDADEVLDAELIQSIQATIKAPTASVYQISRLSNYCGRWIYHSGWNPDHLPRLFQRGQAAYSESLVHEKLNFSGPAPLLAGQLLHYSFDRLDDVLDKVNRYSSAGAEQRFLRGERSGLGKAIYKGLWAFIRTYVLQRGFLDGREGFILAVSNAEGTYYRYLKLMYLGSK
ncbi:glycosyltransferase family 2 protein [uncultured Deefgea sp.]|uniref:glycosyltransferase family 2 protein n=1 Tax=uncultured Deefgea sp. TaxID=1304914 RepID=UPI002633130D|nr:glycosyltransferase family 2 protein [uncultured Deefgea sp.]